MKISMHPGRNAAPFNYDGVVRKLETARKDNTSKKTPVTHQFQL